MKLAISAAPHIRDNWTSQKIMMTVFLSLIPAAIAGVWFFGLNALMVILISIASAWITDIALQYLISRHQDYEIKSLNWSSLLTGLLIGLILPPGVVLWLPAVGSFVAVAIGKHAFGKGNNIFNPALVGRVFLVLSFPALMAAWIIPDGITSASPLTIFKLDGYSSLVNAFGGAFSLHKALFIGNVGGSIGETSALALLVGASVLFLFKIINWRIPTMYLGSVAVISLFFGRDVLFDLLSGGLLLGAFFMATDYVTSPITKNGKLVFGLGCGILTMLFRLFSAYPEGIAFSILLMNAAVPIIERYTRPNPYGK